jgi:flagellin-like hook-associated protein FlgL
MTIAVSATPQENGDVAGILNEMIRLRDTMLESNPSIDKVMNLRAGAILEGTFADSPTGSTINTGANQDLKVGDKIKLPTAAGGLSANKEYFVRSLSTNSIELSEIPGGPAVSLTSAIPAGTKFQRVGGLQHMEDTVLSALSRQGTIQYRLETAMKDLETRYEATEQLISKDADIDFAEATVRLNRAQMAYQAAIQSGAMIQRNSLLDYVR